MLRRITFGPLSEQEAVTDTADESWLQRLSE